MSECHGLQKRKSGDAVCSDPAETEKLYHETLGGRASVQRGCPVVPFTVESMEELW